MLDQINQALTAENYSLAEDLLKQLKTQQPDNPWLQFYYARLQETKGDLENAEKSYKQVLLNTINKQILSQARAAIKRLADLEKNKVQAKLQQSLEKAKTEEGNEELAVLILEPIKSELKKTLAQSMAKIMNIDAYTARLQLPTKHWRLYRTGNLAQLKSYADTLTDANIPCFAVSLKELETIEIYQVKYIESISPEVKIICINKNGEDSSFSFNWSEITQKVEALLPIFESSLEVNRDWKISRKTTTLDYAQILDLHLSAKKTIIRFGDYQYNFAQGLPIAKADKKETNRENWNNLKQFLKPYLIDVFLISDFTAFAEKAIDFKDMLERIQPHINLLRREESLWDAAFELYTALSLIHSEVH